MQGLGGSFRVVKDGLFNTVDWQQALTHQVFMRMASPQYPRVSMRTLLSNRDTLCRVMGAITRIGGSHPGWPRCVVGVAR